LDELDVLRCKLAEYGYCLRFEGILDTIARDGYALRATYNGKGSALLKMAWQCIPITLRHIKKTIGSRP
jgi:hypothetical protein